MTSPAPIRDDLVRSRGQGHLVTPEEEHSQRLLDAARKDYAGFYLIASRDEAELLNTLVLAKSAADALTIHRPKAMPEVVRLHLEKTGDAVDQLFAHARDQLRVCAAFGRLPEEEQKRINDQLLGQ